jgi:hypothetical protein
MTAKRKPSTYFTVMTSTARVKGRAHEFGRYSNVAVLECEAGIIPKMISARARGVIRIVKHWGACSVGKTERSAFRVAMRAAQELADRLNAGESA